MKKVIVTASENIRHYYEFEAVMTDEEYNELEKATPEKQMAMITGLMMFNNISWDDVDDFNPEYGGIEDFKISKVKKVSWKEIKKYRVVSERALVPERKKINEDSKNISTGKFAGKML